MGARVQGTGNLRLLATLGALVYDGAEEFVLCGRTLASDALEAAAVYSYYEELVLDTPDNHDYYCSHCNEGGDIVLCDRCPRVFHKSCVPRLTVLPVGPWECPVCALELAAGGPRIRPHTLDPHRRRLSDVVRPSKRRQITDSDIDDFAEPPPRKRSNDYVRMAAMCMEVASILGDDELDVEAHKYEDDSVYKRGDAMALRRALTHTLGVSGRTSWHTLSTLVTPLLGAQS